jgi:cell division protein FtsL
MLLSSRRRLGQQQINAMNERIAALENDNRELRTQLHEAQRRQSVMADDDQNKKDDGMSQGVATIYRALFEELRFAKQQQWMATNYLLLVLAAIFGIGKVIEPLTECEKVIATFLLLTAVGVGCYVLIGLQMYMGNIRERLVRIEGKESKFFSPEEREVLQFEKYKHPLKWTPSVGPPERFS